MTLKLMVSASALIFAAALANTAAARGMDGQDRRFERAQRLDRLCDGVRDVVELEV